MTPCTFARLAWTLSAALSLAASQPVLAADAQRILVRYSAGADGLDLTTSDGRYLIKPYADNIVETTFVPRGEQSGPASHAVVLAPGAVAATVKEDGKRIELVTGGITVTVDKNPFRLSYSYKGGRWSRRRAAMARRMACKPSSSHWATMKHCTAPDRARSA
jgi:oligosaccharide 4-alpha-D-glucosyltransferase